MKSPYEAHMMEAIICTTCHNYIRKISSGGGRSDQTAITEVVQLLN